MNADLEATLKELGEDYADMVRRMKKPFEQIEKPAEMPVAARRMRALQAVFSSRGLAGLVAACALFAFGFWFVVDGERGETSARGDWTSYTLAYSGSEDALRRIVDTQGSDGSWANDFITVQNAAALRGAAWADVSYRRAVRYLRTRGLSPLSDTELRARAGFAALRHPVGA